MVLHKANFNRTLIYAHLSDNFVRYSVQYKLFIVLYCIVLCGVFSLYIPYCVEYTACISPTVWSIQPVYPLLCGVCSCIPPTVWSIQTIYPLLCGVFSLYIFTVWSIQPVYPTVWSIQPVYPLLCGVFSMYFPYSLEYSACISHCVEYSARISYCMEYSACIFYCVEYLACIPPTVWIIQPVYPLRIYAVLLLIPPNTNS